MNKLSGKFSLTFHFIRKMKYSHCFFEGTFSSLFIVFEQHLVCFDLRDIQHIMTKF